MQKSRRCRLFYIISVLIAIWLFVKHLLKPVLPFAAAWLFSSFLTRPIDRFSKRTGVKRSAVSFLFCSAAILILCCTMYIFSSVFLSELSTIIYSLEDEIPDIVSEISGLVSRLHLGLLSFSIDAPLINSAAKRLLSQLLSLSSPQLAGAIFSIPGTVISLDEGKIFVACGDGVIAVTRLLPEGKGRMDSCDYIRGRKIKINDILGE